MLLVNQYQFLFTAKGGMLGSRVLLKYLVSYDRIAAVGFNINGPLQFKLYS